MSAFQTHKDLAYSTIPSGGGPSPALSGNSLMVQPGDGTKFAAVSMITVWPAGTLPTTSNAEIMQVNTVSTDTLIVTRAQEGTTPLSVSSGYQVAATITTKPFTDIESSLGRMNADVTLYGAIGNGVGDDSTFIQNAANSLTNGGMLFLPNTGSSYVINTPVSLPSNVIVYSNGATITSNVPTVSTHNGLFSISNKSNITIRGLNFNVPGSALQGWAAITSYGHSNLLIEDCTFTGSSGAFGGIINLEGQFANAAKSKTIIQNNTFSNFSNTIRIIQLQTGTGFPISDTRIIDNTFSNTSGPCVFLDGAHPDAISNTLIQGNTFLNTNWLGSGQNPAAAIYGFITPPSSVTGTRILNNYYNNQVVNGAIQKHFVEALGWYDTIIDGNQIYSNWTSSSSEASNVISIGQQYYPITRLKFTNNFCYGFSTIWDPDSMIDVEVAHNTFEYCGDNLQFGYGVMENVRVYDNYFHNCARPTSIYLAAMRLGGGKPIKCEFSGNRWVEDRGIPAPSGVAANTQSGGTLIANATYYYVVTALDAVGETIASTEVSATTSSSNRKINVSWNYEVGALSFNIYRTLSSGGYGPSSLVTNVNSNFSNNFTDSGGSLSAGSPPFVSTTAPTPVVQEVLYIQSTTDNSDLVFSNNYFYLPYGAFTRLIFKEQTSATLPGIMNNNQVVDTTGAQYIYESQAAGIILKGIQNPTAAVSGQATIYYDSGDKNLYLQTDTGSQLVISTTAGTSTSTSSTSTSSTSSSISTSSTSYSTSSTSTSISTSSTSHSSTSASTSLSSTSSSNSTSSTSTSTTVLAFQ